MNKQERLANAISENSDEVARVIILFIGKKVGFSEVKELVKRLLEKTE